jgi:hypothetical protein
MKLKITQWLLSLSGCILQLANRLTPPIPISTPIAPPSPMSHRIAPALGNMTVSTKELLDEKDWLREETELVGMIRSLKKGIRVKFEKGRFDGFSLMHQDLRLPPVILLVDRDSKEVLSYEYDAMDVARGKVSVARYKFLCRVGGLGVSHLN